MRRLEFSQLLYQCNAKYAFQTHASEIDLVESINLSSLVCKPRFLIAFGSDFVAFQENLRQLCVFKLGMTQADRGSGESSLDLFSNKAVLILSSEAVYVSLADNNQQEPRRPVSPTKA